MTSDSRSSTALVECACRGGAAHGSCCQGPPMAFDGIQPAHRSICSGTTAQQTISKARTCLLSSLSTTDRGLSQGQAGKMFPPETQSADRDRRLLKTMLCFASIKEKKEETKAQAIREALDPIYGVERQKTSGCWSSITLHLHLRWSRGWNRADGIIDLSHC
jgi:hypothetical protein